MPEEVRIVEIESAPSNAKMLHGLPDVGLVGVIAVSEIISQLKMVEVAYVDSDLLPPVIVLQNGLPHSPIRIFMRDNLLALISEIAIPTSSLQPLMKALVNWMYDKKIETSISIGGVATPNRQNIESPKVYGVASNEISLKILEENGVNIMERGFLVGPQALILQYCAEKGVPAVSLLAQSFYNYPDPEAAAAVITVLNQMVSISVNVSDLLEKGEEIRLRMRDIMRRTQSELIRMRKSQEYDIPHYYVA
ncbi:TPA: proteasome assembly chaperone family protein [Candidatus Bathyarchaeota archaeon]|nr:proteasome assembly chaperone family protein [Candidatus Bathyarchaeota archaeon]